MKIFVSWSGELSHSIAERLRSWLGIVIPGLETFVSSEDIGKGDAWLPTLFSQLSESSVSIVCLTRENLHADWILFESGAIAKQIGHAKVCTFLIDVSPAEVRPPLSCFQATVLKREDVLRLVKSIHGTLQTPVWKSEAQLEAQFERWWPDLDAHVRAALVAPSPPRTAIQDLAEELLLPVIYREARAGQLDTVFHWLQIAKGRGIADLEGHLGFVEAFLARVTGKRGAAQSLKMLSQKESDSGNKASVELLLLRFAANKPLAESGLLPSRLNSFSSHDRRTACAILGLWHLREGDAEGARSFLHQAFPDKASSGDANDFYRAIPLGVLCFALGRGDLGEAHFDLAKTKPTIPNEGYPFISLLSEFDRSFVVACIGRGKSNVSDERIRDFRGNAWTLNSYAEFFRQSPMARTTLRDRSARWDPPLHDAGIENRLRSFQKRISRLAGGPFLL